MDTYSHNDPDATSGALALHKQEVLSVNEGHSGPSKGGLTPARLLAILALALTNVGAQIHSFFLGVGFTLIAADLHIGTERSWIPLASGLAAGSVALTVGSVQDLFGRKVPLGIGLLLTIAGYIIIATSGSFAQAVAGSAVTGVGGAFQELGSIAAISEMVPARQRGLFLAANTTLTLLFTPSLLYAQLLGVSGWQWLYWIGVIWNGVALALMAVTYFRMDLTRESRPDGQVRIKDFDFIGAFLLIVGLTLLLVGIQSGGPHPWDSAYVLCQMIIGGALVLIFIFWESRDHGRPLMPFRIFRGQRVVGTALLIGSMASVCNHSVMNLGPEIIQAVFPLSDIARGVISLGPSIGLAVGGIGWNVMLTVLHGHARELLLASTVLMTAFVGAQASITPSGSTTFAILGSFASVGIGGTLIPLDTIVTLACPQDLIGTAIALSSAVRTIGGTIGYAVLNNIFDSRDKVTVPQEMGPRIVKAGYPRNETATFIHEFGAAAVLHEPPPPASPAVEAAALEGFRYGFAGGAQYVFFASIAFGAVAILVSFLMPDIRPYMTNRVLAKSGGGKEGGKQQQGDTESSDDGVVAV